VYPSRRSCDSQVQIQRGIGYVYLCRLYQSNRWAEGDPLSHKQGCLIHQFGVWLGRDLKHTRVFYTFLMQQSICFLFLLLLFLALILRDVGPLKFFDEDKSLKGNMELLYYLICLWDHVIRFFMFDLDLWYQPTIEDIYFIIRLSKSRIYPISLMCCLVLQ
jgi:hypothetical protein